MCKKNRILKYRFLEGEGGWKVYGKGVGERRGGGEEQVHSLETTRGVGDRERRMERD